MQDPLTLLLLGPTAKGVPGLVGVATLSLQIEDAQHDFSDTCSSRAQPLPLISPSGEKIGHITAAARIVCCQPAASEQLESQASQDSVGSKTAKVSSNSSAAPAALQQVGLEAVAAEQPAKQSAALFRTVSAAVQTDAPQAQDRSFASSQPLQESVQPLQPQQELQKEPGTAASSMAVSKDALSSQPSDAPGVVQSLHIHICPPGSHVLPAPSSEQQAAQPPPIINISQPTFNFAVPQQVQAAPLAEPLGQTSAQTHAVMAPVTEDPMQRLQQVQPPAAQGSTAVAGDMQQMLHRLQAAVEQLAAPSKANQVAGTEALQLVQASDDFESWRPVTSVPFSSSTAAEAAGLGGHTNGSVAEVGAESVSRDQYCSGAHELTFGQPKPCNHQVQCPCRTLCHVHCAKSPLPSMQEQKPSCRGRQNHLDLVGILNASWHRLLCLLQSWAAAEFFMSMSSIQHQ